MDSVTIPSFWPTVLLALGFAFVLEGLFYTVFAAKLPAMFEMLVTMPTRSIRRMGMVVALAGLAWMMWVRWAMFGA